jgi:ubiquinone/menaquinone biosynthesis C-methylase UbiE
MSDSDNKIKKTVMDYYDAVGWSCTDDGEYDDMVKYEDLRSISSTYRHKCHLRINRHLRKEGKFLLDAASGPVQHPEYLTYSDGYKYHLCVDLSVEALKKARERLGAKGLFVLCDVTNLPFSNNSVHGFVSLHTIYHVPAGEQRRAFLELYRVLNTNSTGVIVYNWSYHGLLMAILMPHIFISRFFSEFINNPKKLSSRDGKPRLHFKALSYKWFSENVKPWINYDLLVWRSVSVKFLKTYVHHWLFGEKLLSVIYRLEEKYPHVLGRIGEYPMFVVRKTGG